MFLFGVSGYISSLSPPDRRRRKRRGRGPAGGQREVERSKVKGHRAVEVIDLYFTSC